MKRNMLVWLVTTTVLATQSALAQDDAFDLDEILVSPSLSPVEASRTGATVEVLDQEEIATEDPQLLRRLIRLPGVNYTSNGPLGAAANIQVRGLPGRYVGVRLNGIDITDPSSTQVNLNYGGLTPSGIGRIELLKGSQSALYGSEAIGGVINIQTYRPEELGFSGQAQIEAGSYETYSGQLNLGYRSEDGYVALSYGYIDSEGFSSRAGDSEKDGFDQSTLNFSTEYNLSDNFAVGGAIYYRDGTVEFDNSATDPTGTNSTEALGGRIFAQLTTGIVQHELSYSAFENKRKDPGSDFTREFNGERYNVTYLGSADFNAQWTLNFGLEYTKEEFSTVPGPSPFASPAASGSEEDTSGFFEALYSPTDQIDLSLALRYSDNSTFGGQTTGRLSAVWRPVEGLAFRAVAGTGYRAPSLFERFSQFGDRNLQPEESQSYELGVEKDLAGRGFIRATVFHTRIKDRIDFDPNSTACSSGFGCYNQVPGSAISEGIELAGEYDINDMFTIYGSYTYVDATTNGTRFARTPKHDAVLGVNADFNSRFSGFLDVSYIADVVPSAFAPPDNLVGDYTLVGGGLSYDVTEDAEIYLRVDNIFDEDYQTAGGFNQPGRSAYVGLRANF